MPLQIYRTIPTRVDLFSIFSDDGISIMNSKIQPAFVVLGFRLSLPIDCIYSTPQTTIYATPSDCVFTMKQKLQETHQLMREYMDVEQECQKSYYDRSKYGPSYKVGE